MIDGAHMIIYSKDCEADRAFFKDVLGWSHVDVGHGWLIFKMPPSEIALHPGEEGNTHEIYFMTSDLTAAMASLAERGVACEAPTDQGWGVLTRLQLPGGGQVGLYEPRHARAT